VLQSVLLLFEFASTPVRVSSMAPPVFNKVLQLVLNGHKQSCILIYTTQKTTQKYSYIVNTQNK